MFEWFRVVWWCLLGIIYIYIYMYFIYSPHSQVIHKSLFHKELHPIHDHVWICIVVDLWFVNKLNWQCYISCLFFMWNRFFIAHVWILVSLLPSGAKTDYSYIRTPLDAPLMPLHPVTLMPLQESVIQQYFLTWICS